MGDMKDALRKAGLVSDKEARQAAHRERVRRKETGGETLEAERRAREAESRADSERRRNDDRAREEERRIKRAGDETNERVIRLLIEGDLLPREAGPKRFFFVANGGRISFIDVSDSLVRRLAQGDAAVVDMRGIPRRDYSAVSGKTAADLKQLDPARILVWNI